MEKIITSFFSFLVHNASSFYVGMIGAIAINLTVFQLEIWYKGLQP